MATNKARRAKLTLIMPCCSNSRRCASASCRDHFMYDEMSVVLNVADWPAESERPLRRRSNVVSQPGPARLPCASEMVVS